MSEIIQSPLVWSAKHWLYSTAKAPVSLFGREAGRELIFKTLLLKWGGGAGRYLRQTVVRVLLNYY